MEDQKELTKKLFDYMILLVEIESIQRQKHEAVKKQKYEDAANLRDKELELMELVPSIQTIKELRSKLD